MIPEDAAYYRRRACTEAKLARVATCEVAKMAHFQLAQEYDRKARELAAAGHLSSTPRVVREPFA